MRTCAVEGMVAVVTGASDGIGRAVALALAQSGAKLGLIARTPERLVEIREECRIFGASTLVAPADVKNESALRYALDSITEEHGPIDVLINAAGVGQPRPKYVEDLPTHLLEHVVDTNFLGTFFACRHLVGRMKQRRRGWLINIGSMAGQHTRPGNVAYSASKHAVRALTDGLAAECDGTGVKVHLISPGPVDTPILDKKERPPSASERKLMLRPADIAEIVVWLLALPPRVRIDNISVRPVGEPLTKSISNTD